MAQRNLIGHFDDILRQAIRDASRLGLSSGSSNSEGSDEAFEVPEGSVMKFGSLSLSKVGSSSEGPRVHQKLISDQIEEGEQREEVGVKSESVKIKPHLSVLKDFLLQDMEGKCKWSLVESAR